MVSAISSAIFEIASSRVDNCRSASLIFAISSSIRNSFLRALQTSPASPCIAQAHRSGVQSLMPFLCQRLQRERFCSVTFAKERSVMDAPLHLLNLSQPCCARPQPAWPAARPWMARRKAGSRWSRRGPDRAIAAKSSICDGRSWRAPLIAGAVEALDFGEDQGRTADEIAADIVRLPPIRSPRPDQLRRLGADAVPVDRVSRASAGEIARRMSVVVFRGPALGIDLTAPLGQYSERGGRHRHANVQGFEDAAQDELPRD